MHDAPSPLDTLSMIVRFDIRPDERGWTIFDRLTGDPAVVDGMSTVGLPYAEADDLADLLNTLQVLKGGTTVH